MRITERIVDWVLKRADRMSDHTLFLFIAVIIYSVWIAVAKLIDCLCAG